MFFLFSSIQNTGTSDSSLLANGRRRRHLMYKVRIRIGCTGGHHGSIFQMADGLCGPDRLSWSGLWGTRRARVLFIVISQVLIGRWGWSLGIEGSSGWKKYLSISRQSIVFPLFPEDFLGAVLIASTCPISENCVLGLRPESNAATSKLMRDYKSNFVESICVLWNEKIFGLISICVCDCCIVLLLSLAADGPCFE